MTIRLLPYFIAVYRTRCDLELWYRGPTRTHYRLIDTFRVAVGAVGYDTPAGVYFVQAKARNPDWRMPDSPWVAPEDRGKVIPGGHPDNPLVGSFLKLTDDGVGIHGTRDINSLGNRASHGCIRVEPHVARYLHKRVPIGTPVHII